MDRLPSACGARLAGGGGVTTTFMPVVARRFGDASSFETVHFRISDHAFDDRAAAVSYGLGCLNHDDFRIATLVDGRLAAIGSHTWDFTADEEDLPEIAGQLGFEVSA
jgi:hypothetical protein